MVGLSLLLGFGMRVGRAQATTGLNVPKGTVVPLRLLDQVATGSAKGGDPLHFEALRDVVVDGHLLVRAGAPASGEVDSVAKSWKGLEGGQIRIALKQVALADGESLPLDSIFRSYGGGVDQTSKLAELGSAVPLLDPGSAALMLLAGGQDLALPKGTRMDGYVANPAHLDAAKFASAGDAAAAASSKAAPLQAQPPKEQLRVSTLTGDGSLYVDGEFRAEAPATLDLDRGVHLLTVRRDGYRVWKQRVLVDGDGLELLVPLVKK